MTRDTSKPPRREPFHKWSEALLAQAALLHEKLVSYAGCVVRSCEKPSAVRAQSRRQ
jgi:hypothetical protein